MRILVSGQLPPFPPPPRGKLPQVRVGVLVKVRVSFRVGGQPDNCPGRKIPPLGFGLGLVLGLEGGGGQFSSGAIVLEPRILHMNFQILVKIF